MIINTVAVLLLIWALFLMYWVTSAFIGFVRTRVPFVPSPKNDIEFIVRELNISEKDVFYELGSGNGRVVFLVEKLSGAKSVGFELTGWTYWYAKFKAKIIKSKAQFFNKDFFKEPWHEATVIYCYLYPPLMKKMEEKFLRETKSGSVAIVRDFPFPALKPNVLHKMPNDHHFYIYKKM